MKFPLQTVILVVILFSFLACKHEKNSNKSNIETIDLYDSYENRKEVKLSSIADNIEYVQLESSEKCLFEEPYLIAANDSLILIITFKKILLFSRQDGTFKHEISSYGRGPNEYLSNIGNSYDEKTATIYTTSGSPGTLVTGFSLTGEVNIRFKKPEPNFKSKEEFSIPSFWPLSKNLFVGYSKNYSGNNLKKLVTFDSTGKILSSIKNYNYFDKTKYDAGTLSQQQGWFFTLGDSIRFFELYTDTIFSLTRNQLLPRFYIKMDRYSLPYYLQGVFKEYENERLKYFYIKDIRESSRFVIFTVGIGKFRHFCFYDKVLKSTWFCDTPSDKEYYRYPTYYESRIIGMENDIDNFIPFGTGKGGLYINQKDELCSYIPTTYVVRWFQMNPDKAARLPADLQKFSDVKATDNIIIQIVKLKK